MNKKALVAMSGGVDSAAAAIILSSAGYDTMGVTMKLWSSAERVTDVNSQLTNSDIDDAKMIADKLNIPHRVISLGDTFRECVIDKFISEYKSGSTPNPCVECNKCIKFGRLLDIALEWGYDYLATGHYARIERGTNGRFLIKKAADADKDQSYVLWQLTQATLSHVLLPLGDLTKREIRELVANTSMSFSHKSDSQDICFIPDKDYVRFILDNSDYHLSDGDFLDTHGNVIGRHNDMIKYTVGQRKGLGMGFGKPMFVMSKDAKKNTVTLCDDAELYSKTLFAKNINLIACDDLKTPTRLEAKIRYKSKQSIAIVTQISEDRIMVEFSEPQRAIAKGQSVVLYDGDTLVGGGIIE